MTSKLFYLAQTALIICAFSGPAIGRSLSAQRVFLEDCAKLGTRTVSETPIVMDYSRLGGGESDQVVCVYDVRCVAPKYSVDERTAVFCQYDRTMGCEDFDACVREMPKREMNLRPAGGAKPKEGDRCKSEPKSFYYVRPKARDENKTAPAVCVHVASCSDQTNAAQPELHPPGVVFCETTGKTEPMVISGTEYQVPVCPSATECVDDKLPTETHASHQQRLAEAREAQERSTSARNSATQPVANNQPRHNSTTANAKAGSSTGRATAKP